jgi:Ca2+-binding EF-hand superfamily protein
MQIPAKLILIASICAASAVASPSAAAQSLSEMARAREQLRDADDNGDAIVTRAEFQAHANAQWAKMDRDRDGYFTRADLPVYAKAKWDADPAAALRRRADTNRDGRISRGEFRARHALAFEIGDSNRNGTVSKSEMRALDRRIAAR